MVDNAVAKWIEVKFRQIQDVKFATSEIESSAIFRNHDADVVVETWMGSRLYVYLVEKELKSRDIKNTLKHNTGTSVGTLYILNQALLPQNGQTVQLKDWQDDLRVLHSGAIYGYGVIEDALKIIQVNFTETNRRDIYKCWYAKEFPFDVVSVRRRQFNGTIKGTWYVGDIASPQFKRRINNERAQQRFHYRTRQTHEINISPVDRLRTAYLLLEIEVGAGEKAVKDAFRKLAMKYHPDVSDQPKQEAESRFKEIKEAYDEIKSHRKWK